MLCGVFIIMIVSGLAPIGGSLASFSNIGFMEAPWISDGISTPAKSRKVGAKSTFIQIALLVLPALMAWDNDDERHALTFFIHKSLVEPAMFAEEETLVGGVDNDCIVQFTNLFKIIQQTADVFVYG